MKKAFIARKKSVYTMSPEDFGRLQCICTALDTYSYLIGTTNDLGLAGQDGLSELLELAIRPLKEIAERITLDGAE